MSRLLAALLLAASAAPIRAAAPAAAPVPSASWNEFYASIPPLPDLPNDRTYTLRVLYLEDERLPTLSPDQLRELYAKAEKLLLDWYGYRVHIQDAGRRSLTGYFLSHNAVFEKPAFADGLKGMILDIDTSEGRKELLESVRRDFESRPLTQIAAYLHREDLKTKEQAARAAARLFLDRLAEIRNIRLPDGRRFYDKLTARLTSFPHWDVLLYDVDDADFILTNSMMASADSAMPIYVIIRGGITTGMVTNNLHNSYRACGVVGLYPFLSNAPFFLRERGRIPREDLLDLVATFWMHELGHFFLRLAEAYDHPHCVHVAPLGLSYPGWYYEIKKYGACTLEHRRLTKY